MTQPTIRPATSNDAPAITAIYEHHVAHGTATFDTVAPDADAWRGKIADIAVRGWPFLVAEDGGAVIGYAYAAQFRDRAAYNITCEDSIYIAPQSIGRGVGRALLSALIDAARASGFQQMLAVIGDGEPGSVALHARAGFTHTGTMTAVGRKFGRLLDVVIMQAHLREGR